MYAAASSSSWKSRFFRLEGDKLRYYAAREDSTAKGEIDISKGPTVRFSDEKASGGQVEIEIVTPDRTYRLRCARARLDLGVGAARK